MPTVTRTLGPLHFEDLDPKRFEDLVRQLIYDFRPWKSLEGPGRAGSDDGFDVRGYESIAPRSGASDDDREEDLALPSEDRLWLVQCKRERRITPTKLVGYLEKIRLADREVLHGLIFAAACDFSKASRDIFSRTCREKGLEEWYLWGKAELEDQLLRPANDHLLFAYFGVSLNVRRRSKVTSLRAKLAAKRKAERCLDGRIHRPALIRALDDGAYPCSQEVPNFSVHPPWRVFNYLGPSHAGLLFEVSRHFAFLDDNSESWDAAMAHNDSLHHGDDPWDEESGAWEKRNVVWEAWSALPEPNRAWMTITGVVPYESLIEIDSEGDDVADMPHLFVDFRPQDGPFAGTRAEVVVAGTMGAPRRSLSPSGPNDSRLTVFPEGMRSKPQKTGE
jgi:hypothetical protein